MAPEQSSSADSGRLIGFPFDLAAEAITVRIRWFGVLAGFALVNLIARDELPHSSARDVFLLNIILGIGAIYTLFDSYWSLRGRVFLSEWPLAVSALESVFVGLLCHFDLGEESAFRFYYFLSLMVCAIRYPPLITAITFCFHGLSFSVLLLSHPGRSLVSWVIFLVLLGWLTWAITRLAGLFRAVSARLAETNEQLEQRIALRTQELRESQAMLVQQEKQAAFGLLAAGIAHEVGNPLAAISSLVQLLKKKSTDQYTQDRYQMMGDQLLRIQGTLRELIDFSRPATKLKTVCHIHEVVEGALNIAKYYKRRKGKRIITRYAAGLPTICVMRDQLVQVFLNLIQNAMDATREGGMIEITTSLESGWIRISVRDDGEGVKEADLAKLFEPYFTTKQTGTGLGLFVCRHVLERAGSGKIELTSTGPTGTIFSVLVTSEGLVDHPDVPPPAQGVDHSLSTIDALVSDASDAGELKPGETK